ncbi:L10-interacting MYB domain-containing protein-like [Senna tora]|uniref:L10-interacting MYB domain-containing protein-like n=1 Tax=Senna tora TaxID=362788 RepID=A0A834TT65_9FABA|nr:L10-interacting MYB domain-containing protein-like [Senna tora]
MPPKQYANKITKQNSLELDNVGYGEGKKTIKASNEWWAAKGKKDVIATGYVALAPYQDLSSGEDGNNDGDASGSAAALEGEVGANYEEDNQGANNVVNPLSNDQRKRKRGGKVDRRSGISEKP